MQYVSFKPRLHISLLPSPSSLFLSLFIASLFLFLSRYHRAEMGVCFPHPNNNKGGAQFLKPYTLHRHACTFPHTYMSKVHMNYIGMTEEALACPTLVSEEHSTLFFYFLFLSSSSLRCPFAFRSPHSNSSALPSSLIKPGRLSAKRTSPGTLSLNITNETTKGQEKYRQTGGRRSLVERPSVGHRIMVISCWS